MNTRMDRVCGVRVAGGVLALLIAMNATGRAASREKVLFEESLIGEGHGKNGRVLWILEGGEARATAAGLQVRDSIGETFLLEGVAVGDESWRDYKLALEVKLEERGTDWRDGVWLGVRCTPNQNMYVLGFYSGQLWLSKNVVGVSVSDNKPLMMTKEPVAALPEGQWRRIEVTAIASKLTVSVDGVKVLDFIDNAPEKHLAPLTRGCVMLGARRSRLSDDPTVAVFRNVKVTVPEGSALVPDSDMDQAVTKGIQPWRAREIWPTMDDIYATLRAWSEKHDDRMTLETVGMSLEGDPILAAIITDRSVPDDDKHSIMITAFDSGWERSGTCGALHTMEWLMGGSRLARQARRYHQVVFMPIPNPHGYRNHLAYNSKKVNPYHGGRGRSDHWDLQKIEVKNPEDAPHMVAITKVFDKYQPEFILDMHGVGLKYAGQLVQPSLGSAYSNTSNRPWDWRLLETMIGYANRSGHAFVRMEVDAQQSYFPTGLEAYSKRFWMGRPLFYTAQYGYAKYHTMPCTVEVGWPEGAVEAVKGLLDFGVRQFKESPVPGLPVNRAVYQPGNLSVCAYGATAKERRRSRVELWQRQEEIMLGSAYPYTDGRIMAVCGVGENTSKKLFGDKKGPTIPIHDFLRNIRRFPGLEHDVIDQYALSGPQYCVYMSGMAEPPREGKAFAPPQQGLAIEIPVFYRAPKLLDVRLNGRLLTEDAADRYQVWYSEWEGYTLLRVNVP
ncbi:MAG: DUF1080 domain-containing protein, partial [Kiritimatiellae bacterium]|nr:DUF1080 domain-containing protein [Kiritimatiellia bacterium]